MTTDRSVRKSSRRRWIVVLNIVLFVLIGFGFGEEYLRNQEVQNEITRMQNENAQLEAQKLSSLSLIDSLSSSYYVESEARQSGLGQPDERLIIVEDHGAEQTTSSALSYDDVPNPVRWYYYFFDRAQFDVLQSGV